MEMGSRLSCDRIKRQQMENENQQQQPHSIVLHQETTNHETNYSITYKPPLLQQRLMPGEPRPRFWMNSSDTHPTMQIVSVSWTQSHLYDVSTPSTRRNRSSNVKRFNMSSSKKPLTNRETDGNICSQEHWLDGMSSKQNGIGDGNSLIIQSYPQFMMPFVDQMVKVRVTPIDQKAREMVGSYCHLRPGQINDPSTEMAYLIRNMHFLRLHLTYSMTVKGLPVISIEENHGGLKRLKKVRYRTMPVSWIDLDHHKNCITAVGENFQLFLEVPSSNVDVDDYPEGNGEVPTAVGIYTRSLDTAPDVRLQFKASIFSWFCQSEHSGDLHKTFGINALT